MDSEYLMNKWPRLRFELRRSGVNAIATFSSDMKTDGLIIKLLIEKSAIIPFFRCK